MPPPPKPLPAAASGMDNTARRKWELTDAEKKAEAREQSAEEMKADLREEKRRQRLAADPLHNGTIAVRSNLQARAVDLKLDAGVGKTMMLAEGPLGMGAGAAGFYCPICDCTLKDSLGYLDHINGKKHQHALGMNLRAERSTLEEVKAKLARLKAAKAAGKKGAAAVAAANAAAAMSAAARPLAIQDAATVAARPKVAQGGGDGALRDDDDDEPAAKRARAGDGAAQPMAALS